MRGRRGLSRLGTIGFGKGPRGTMQPVQSGACARPLVGLALRVPGAASILIQRLGCRSFAWLKSRSSCGSECHDLLPAGHRHVNIKWHSLIFDTIKIKISHVVRCRRVYP